MDFKELPVDGQAFEQLLRELLFSMGLHVAWSGVGPDGGRDLICKEILAGHLATQERTWLVQCKHKAHGGGSVGVADLDDIVTSCTQHNATGYLLACSTQPSSAVVQRLEAVSANPQTSLTATYWDRVMIERLLSQPKHWAIAQRFMPVSNGNWKIYATEAPNDFIAHYSGYVFHLTNRIGSVVEHHLPSIESRIKELEEIPFPKGHFIRPRAVWYDDKNGGYKWYVDYMRPNKEQAAVSRSNLLDYLKDGWALDDGQIYSWDIQYVKYSPFSDHYDEDHYDYYTRYLPNFLNGNSREDYSEREHLWATEQELEGFEQKRVDAQHNSFTAMVEAVGLLPYLRVIRAINCNVEVLWSMERRFDWSDLLEEFDADTDNIFTATLILEVTDQPKFFDLLEKIPNEINWHFRVSRVFVFLPDTGLDTADDELMFDLRLMVHPTLMSNQRAIRSEFIAYFDSIKQVIEGEPN